VQIKALHLYDCLRANKSTSAWGVEARVPFLDKDFIDLAMSIDPAEKMVQLKEGRIEKYILRKAFDDKDDPFLPQHILFRQKEQFSDGVGYSWIDGLKDHAASHVTDLMMANAVHVYPHNTPGTKEAYYYRMLFEKHFPQVSTFDSSSLLLNFGGHGIGHFLSYATWMYCHEQKDCLFLAEENLTFHSSY
jgi:asparagine synthase (glutamine-hydrolysing)